VERARNEVRPGSGRVGEEEGSLRYKEMKREKRERCRAKNDRLRPRQNRPGRRQRLDSTRIHLNDLVPLPTFLSLLR
jgi:hypothetical protein